MKKLIVSLIILCGTFLNAKAFGHSLDIEVDGAGFLVLQDEAAKPVYSKSGIFEVNPTTRLLELKSSGHKLMGYLSNNLGQIGTSLEPIQAPGNLPVDQIKMTSMISGQLLFYTGSISQPKILGLYQLALASFDHFEKLTRESSQIYLETSCSGVAAIGLPDMKRGFISSFPKVDMQCLPTIF